MTIGYFFHHCWLHETLALLTSQLHPDAKHKEDLVFLKDVFSEKSLAYLMKLAEEIQNGPMEGDERELLLLLSAPHLKAILAAHDTVAQKNFDPVLPPLPDEVDDELEEESVKIVRLVKNKEPLGATIRRDEVTGAVLVARIMRGGAADRSGLVHVGDELREVNGNLIIHKRPDEISQILSQSQGSITLKIIPAVAEEYRLKESKVYLRALFDYTPFEDKATPCQEAGLPFKRGDILQVVSQDDATWWQAKRVGDSNLRAALIPSTQFQESEGSQSGQDIAGLRRSFCLSRKDRQGSPGEPRIPDSALLDFLIYEEVTRYQPHPSERPRLVVLIGSLGARINELKQKVIAENPCHFGVAVPHTTRAKKSHEREGVEYNFITKQAFEADIQSNIFIEYGEYKDHFYGTSLEAIRSVLDRNKICLVDVQPEALKILWTAEFKPYVIFVKPRIHESHCKRHGSSSSLSEMRQSAVLMGERYGHLVDRVLVKEDLASACVELRDILQRVETEVHWVPIGWARTT
uniref:Membrane protein, palmitoylated 3b (MAGUK p55 subfamily member 3) n=1 Tax=Oncorhynchus tshawytscha TaxID=74940 RepID=A0A8C8JPK0_ONCTS